ncbi:Transposase [Rhizobiales bacterium GAS113]|nr:Transposase [Rhizobiales bacterium GAS113]
MKRSQSTTKKRTKKPGQATTTKTMRVGGVDVGKDWLDAAIHGIAAKPLRRPNTPQGRAALIEFFIEHGVTLIGIEASGSYEFEMVDAIRAAGLKDIVFQPRQVRAYATFRNLRAKTDPIDAALIARCAAAQEEMRDSPDPRLAPMAEHLTFIDQIKEDIARLRTRLDRFRDKRFITAIRDQIAHLKKLERAELAKLRTAVRAHADLAKKLDLLITIEGLGGPTAPTLVIRMPELGTVSREQAASLAGMAPFTRKSGRWQGESHVEGGRARVGKAVFAAAQAASQRWNKALVALYTRIKAQGKHHSVAVVACARKLIIYANTVLARGTPWIAQN